MTTESNKPNSGFWTKMVAFFAVIGGIIAFIANVGGGIDDWSSVLERFNKDKPGSPYQSSSPIFREDTPGFKILILPFQLLGCSQRDDIGPTIKNRLEDLNVKDSLIISIRYYNYSYSYNFNLDSANALLSINNADMLIYGNYRKVNCNSDISTEVCVNHLLSDNYKIDTLSQVSDRNRYQVATLRDISSGKLMDNVDFILYYISGLSEFSQKNYANAKERFEIARKKLNYETPSLTYHLATSCYHLGEYVKANDLFSQALAGFELSRDTYEMSNVYYWQGNINVALGKYAKALDLFGKSLIYTKKHSNSYHADIGVCYERLAEVYESLGKIPLSAQYYLLALQEKQLQGDETDRNEVAVCYSKVADLHAATYNNKDANYYYLKAIDLFKPSNEDDIYFIAQCHTKLASCLLYLGSDEESLIYQYKALDLYQSLSEKPMYDVSRCCNKIAYLHCRLGKIQEGIDYAYLAHAYSPEDVYVMYISNHILTRLYRNIKEYEKSINCGETAEFIWEKKLREDKIHPIHLVSLAETYSATGDFVSSMRCFAKFDRNIIVLGKEYNAYNYIIYYMSKAEVLKKMNKWKEANDCYFKAMELASKFYPVNHPEVVRLSSYYEESFQFL